MRTSSSRAPWGVVAGILAAAACAGTRLNDVGDIDGEGEAGAGAIAQGGMNQGQGNRAAGGETDLPEPMGGIGGTLIVGPDSGGIHGDGGAGGDGPGFVCDDCVLFAETPDIRAVWAGGDQLYWIEYGSFDNLGNYLDDGRLMAMPFEGGEAAAVASGLQGPIQLGATTDFAYVIVERSSSRDGQLQLARVSLDTGDTTLLQPLPQDLDDPPGARRSIIDWFWRHFAASAGYVFWRKENTVYRLLEATAGPPEPFFQLRLGGDIVMMADDASLYLCDDEGITSAALVGDGTVVPVPVSNAVCNAMSVFEDHIYAVDGSYIARVAKTGGSFKRIAETPGLGANRLQTDGTSYVGDFGVQFDPDGPAYSALTEGALTDSASARTLATAPQWDSGSRMEWRVWDATATHVYLGYEDKLYRVARQY